jgi:hypothetical protein
LNGRFKWLRVLGGGCFVNLAVTGLLVGVFAASSTFSIDSILIPFMAGATASFGLSLYLLRGAPDDTPVMRKVIVAGLGVVLGSILAVLGIAAYILLTGY